MQGKTLYDRYKKAHGQVVVKSPHPALHGDTLEDLPDWIDLTAAEQNGWNAAAKTPKKK